MQTDQVPAHDVTRVQTTINITVKKYYY